MWIAWIIRCIVPFIILAFLLSFISIVQLGPRQSGMTKAIFMKTGWFVGFSVYFIYSVQCTMFTLLMGQIFSNGNKICISLTSSIYNILLTFKFCKAFVGKTVTIVIWLVTAINFFSNSGAGLKYILCIFPNCSLLFAFQVIFQYERSSKSLNYTQLYQNLYGDPMTIGGILLAQILWTLFYIPVTWYIERILPGEYGAPLPLFFPFMVSCEIPRFLCLFYLCTMYMLNIEN